jgi:hypothetical protein
MAGYTKPELGFQANFKPRSIDWPRKHLRDFAVLDQSMLSRDQSVVLGNGGTGAYGPVVEGEWLTFDVDGKLIRALDSDTGASKHYCETPAYIVVAGAGRTDTMTTRMATVYFDAPGLEFETRLFDWASDLTPGQPLTVGSVSFDDGATYKSALKARTGAENCPVVAVVLATPSQTGSGYLRAKLTGQVVL